MSAPRTLTPRALAGVVPMLATSGSELPQGRHWVFEPKYDGVRILAAAGWGDVLLLSRNGNDKTPQFPEIVAAMCALGSELGRPVLLDGEVVAMRDGRALRFHALQPRIHVRNARAAAVLALEQPLSFFAFDCLLDGDEALVEMPWLVRRGRLERLLKGHTGDRLCLTPTSRSAAAMLGRARQEGWEGLVAKHEESPYVQGKRSRSWLKLKMERTQEFIVVGYTESTVDRRLLGSLLLAVFDGDELTFCGQVGTGMDYGDLALLAKRLAPLRRATPPLDAEPSGGRSGIVTWVEPRLVVRVRFNEWTPSGRVRQAVYEGLRDDIEPVRVRREDETVAADLPWSA